MDRRPSLRTERVWDPVVRALHWTLAFGVGLSALGTIVWFGLHRPAGYVAAGAALLRLGWGWVGPPNARLVRALHAPGATLRYAGSMLAGRAPRRLGHNPLGAWMAVTLIGCVLGLALTGWLYTTDAFWGDERVETVHRALAWALAGLVPLHLAGVVHGSWRDRDNLVAAMIDGRKAPLDRAGGDPVG